MQPQAPASAVPFPTAPEVIFTNWREALHRSGLTPGMQAVYTLVVSGYLDERTVTREAPEHMRARKKPNSCQFSS